MPEMVNITIPIPAENYKKLSVLAAEMKTEIISFFNGDFLIHSLSCYHCPAKDCPGDTSWCIEEFYKWLFNKEE